MEEADIKDWLMPLPQRRVGTQLWWSEISSRLLIRRHRSLVIRYFLVLHRNEVFQV